MALRWSPMLRKSSWPSISCVLGPWRAPSRWITTRKMAPQRQGFTTSPSLGRCHDVPWAGAFRPFRHHQDKSMALSDFLERISWLCYVKVDGTKLFLLSSPWRTCHVNNLHSEDPKLISWAVVFLWLLIIRRSQFLICIDLPDWVKRKVAHVWETGHRHTTGIPASPRKVTFRDDEFRQSIRVSTIASPYWSPTLAPRVSWWGWWVGFSLSSWGWWGWI